MYIDDLIEKAFCEGYEYAQREFGLSEALGNARENLNNAFGKSKFNVAGKIRTKNLRNQAAKTLHVARKERDRINAQAANIDKRGLGHNGIFKNDLTNKIREHAGNISTWAPKKGSVTSKKEGNYIKRDNDKLNAEINRRSKINLNTVGTHDDMVHAHNDYIFGK